MNKILCVVCFCILGHGLSALLAQEEEVTAATKLYLTQPRYATPYGETTLEEIKEVMDRVFVFLDETTPIGVIDKNTKKEINDYDKIDKNSIIRQGIFSITNYMWGVTYSAMLNAAEITDDQRYKNYVKKRLRFLAEVGPYFQKVLPEDNEDADPQMRQMLRPEALDDAGAMCAAVIKARRAGIDFEGQPMIDRYMDHIMNKQYRLPDGTFARNRPMRNTLWLDDMYMGVPAIANMGRLTGETKYYDEAIKQVMQFADYMFLQEKGL